MNRIQFLLKAKTQYNIQSPFLYRIYSQVLAPRLPHDVLTSNGISSGDHYAQLLYKLSSSTQLVREHIVSNTCQIPASQSDDQPIALFSDATDLFRLTDGSLLALLHRPHKNRQAEVLFESLRHQASVTMTVDLWYAALFFTSPRLSRQLIMLRVY